MIPFADSISPASISPHLFSRVAAYETGRYAWPAADVGRFDRHIKIGVLPGSPSQARTARVLDIERFDAAPADWVPFANERLAAGHDDATAYCSISTIPALLDAGIPQGNWRLWAAWWWQRTFPPTATEVLAEIATLTGIMLPASRLWACQWQNGTSFDTSVLYGADDFTTRGRLTP